MASTFFGHLVKLFASSWYIFLTYIYDARSHLYQMQECLLTASVLREVLQKDAHKDNVAGLDSGFCYTVHFLNWNSHVTQKQ